MLSPFVIGFEEWTILSSNVDTPKHEILGYISLSKGWDLCNK
jgi:hypothetical protein